MKALTLILFVFTSRIFANELTIDQLTPASSFNIAGQDVTTTILTDTIDPSKLETYGMAIFITNAFQYRNGYVIDLWTRKDYADGQEDVNTVETQYIPASWLNCGLGIYLDTVGGQGVLTYSDETTWSIYEGENNDTLLYNGQEYDWKSNNYLITFDNPNYGSLTLYAQTAPGIPESSSTLSFLLVALGGLIPIYQRLLRLHQTNKPETISFP